MRPFTTGLIAGVTLAAAGLMGLAFAQNSSPPNPRLTAANCQVRVGEGRLQGRFQCDDGQVMVGLLNGTIMCADIDVSCP